MGNTLHDFATGRFAMDGKWASDEVSRRFASVIHQSTKVDITNVAELHIGTHDVGNMKWSLEDFACLASPFELTWFESSDPKTYVEFGEVKTQSFQLKTGWLCVQSKHEDGFKSSWVVLTKQNWSTPAWALVGRIDLNLDAHGAFVSAYASDLAKGVEHVTGNLEQVVDGSELLIPLTAIEFMHCKNVKMVDLPDQRTRQMRRSDERRNVSHVTFKTLQIGPMRQVLETEGGLSQNGLKKALHICRGHFSEYSEDKPLFGKYSGRFWVPSHVRGSADVGTVVKDYKVVPPKATA